MISVIIPVYNREAYIKGCVDSVLNQTNQDVEIIVVDDGSSDKTKDVLSSYGAKIKYIYKQNGGAASARNEGIKNVSGDYIACLDSDDWWFNFKLELQEAVLTKLPEVGFVHSDFSCCSDKKDLIARSYMRDYFFTLKVCRLEFDQMFSNKATLKTLGIKINSVPEETMVYWGSIADFVFMGPMFLPSSVLINKKLIKEPGLFNEHYKTGEDFDFLARIAKRFPVAYIDFPTLMYRRFHADQLSSEAMELESNIVWLEIIKKLTLEDKEYYERNKRKIVSTLSRRYCGLGAVYFKNNRPGEALVNFFNSIKLNYKQKKIYIYILVTCLSVISNKFYSRSRKHA